MSQGSINSEREFDLVKTKHKIELCRAFSEMGYCPYGEMCMFAHGVEELVMHQPALKVKQCRNFHVNGYCRFGQRCNFRHEKNVRTKKNKNQYKFHRIFNGYPDLILGVIMQVKIFQTNEGKCTESSQSSLQ